jgi:hypothetical protein
MERQTMEKKTEPAQVTALYNNLTSYDPNGDTLLVLNRAKGMRYLTVAVAVDAGMAGGERQTHSEPEGLFPGLNEVSKSYIERVEADAKRQRDSGGGVLAQMLDRDIRVIRNLAKCDPSDVAAWIESSANIELIGKLRGDARHGEAAQRAWAAWHERDATNDVRTLRHFWAMRTGSKKVA